MTGIRSGWNELLFGSLLVAGVVLVGLPTLPPATPRVPLAAAVASGAVGALALFRLLAGSGAVPRALRGLGGALLGAAGAVLVVRAVVEEIAWRGFLLGALATGAGAATAFAVTTIGFAFAHAGVHGRQRLVHVASGGLFGGLYLATGHLVSAVTAHVAYNALVSGAVRRAAPP